MSKFKNEKITSAISFPQPPICFIYHSLNHAGVYNSKLCAISYLLKLFCFSSKLEFISYSSTFISFLILYFWFPIHISIRFVFNLIRIAIIALILSLTLFSKRYWWVPYSLNYFLFENVCMLLLYINCCDIFGSSNFSVNV